MKNFIKIPTSGFSLYEFSDFINQKNIQVGDKIYLKFRPKFRWKLKAFRLHEIGSAHCETCGCGCYSFLILKKGEKYFRFDTHLGNSYICGKALV